jgi:endonuclease-8
MDQAVLAGVGNLYRCEVLFRHRVDPFRPRKEIQPTTWLAIWDVLVRLMLGQVLTMDDQVADAMAEVADGSAAAHTAVLTGARLGDRFERRSTFIGAPASHHARGSMVRTQLVARRNLVWCIAASAAADRRAAVTWWAPGRSVTPARCCC